MIALITCVVLVGLMLLGVPVCAAMGGTAAAMCRDYPVPMQIFDLGEEDSIYRAMQGLSNGTRITV